MSINPIQLTGLRLLKSASPCRGWQVYYQCRACRHQTALLSGTIFGLFARSSRNASVRGRRDRDPYPARWG